MLEMMVVWVCVCVKSIGLQTEAFTSEMIHVMALKYANN